MLLALSLDGDILRYREVNSVKKQTKKNNKKIPKYVFSVLDVLILYFIFSKRIFLYWVCVFVYSALLTPSGHILRLLSHVIFISGLIYIFIGGEVCLKIIFSILGQ